MNNIFYRMHLESFVFVLHYVLTWDLIDWHLIELTILLKRLHCHYSLSICVCVPLFLRYKQIYTKRNIHTTQTPHCLCHFDIDVWPWAYIRVKKADVIRCVTLDLHLWLSASVNVIFRYTLDIPIIRYTLCGCILISSIHTNTHKHTHTHAHTHIHRQTNCSKNITSPRFRGGLIKQNLHAVTFIEKEGLNDQ